MKKIALETSDVWSIYKSLKLKLIITVYNVYSLFIDAKG